MMSKKIQVLFTMGVVLLMGTQIISFTLAGSVTKTYSDGFHGLAVKHKITHWSGDHTAYYELRANYASGTASNPSYATLTGTNCLQSCTAPYISGSVTVVWDNKVRNWIWEDWINDGRTITKNGNQLEFGYQTFWTTTVDTPF